jgi:DNA-binding CsgD family transcriptional regulator
MKTSNDGAGVADLFYEAALIPEFWPKACEALAAEVGAATATIFAIDHFGTHRFVCTPNIREGIERFSADPRRFDNVRPARALERFPFTFVREREFITEEELATDVVLNAFIKPIGLHWSAGCAFQEPTGHIFMFDLLRRAGMDHYSDAEIAHLNAIKPDLARSIYLASRLAFNEARTMTSTLSLLGLPSAVIGVSRRVLSANPRFEQLAPRVRIAARDQLTLDNPATADLIRDALARLAAGATPRVQSIPMPPVDEAAPLILHLLPVRRAALDIFARGLAILVVTEVGAVGPPDMRVLAGLFDMTPAEVRIAREIATGKSVEQIAAAGGNSTETVRTHLKRIMSKTGTRRQGELIQLLLGLSAPFAAPGDAE